MKNKSLKKEQTVVKPATENVKIEANTPKNNDGGYIWIV